MKGPILALLTALTLMSMGISSYAMRGSAADAPACCQNKQSCCPKASCCPKGEHSQPVRTHR